jgi:putative cardiolipin synthase
MNVARLAGVASRAALTAALSLLAACATLPPDDARVASTALDDHASTALGREIEARAAQAPKQSGFTILRRGREAFTARVAMADLAERTIDVQYYLWESDATGTLLARQLHRAAERGVRVRILVDDVNLDDQDTNLAAFDAHPNIEVRIFNPFAHRASKALGFVADFDRVNHRMHNKLIVVDNAVAIVGGRNMGDPYYEVDPEFNFRDLDVVAAGPVVRELSKVFDRFWNGEWSVRVASLVGRPVEAAYLADPAQAKRFAAAMARYPHPLDQDVATLRSSLSAVFAQFVWAPGRVIYDDPASIRDPRLRVMHDLLIRRIERLEREILIEAAYFIPLDADLPTVRALTRRGVRVRLLTNSLASNDVVPAFAGYSRIRRALVEAGVEVHELRHDPGPARKRELPAGSKARLHTKAIVFDRNDVFIGSFNLDARSSSINTEAGLYIESPALAARVVEYMDTGASGEVSYRLALDADRRLAWHASDDGKPLSYDVDPLTTPGLRFRAWWWSLLPILEQL